MTTYIIREWELVEYEPSTCGRYEGWNNAMNAKEKLRRERPHSIFQLEPIYEEEVKDGDKNV